MATVTRRRKRGILGENCALEPLELRPGLEPELAGEQPAAVAVDLQRVALPATAIEGEHRLATQALAQGIRGDERVELSDELAVASELQERFDPVFRRREPEVVEAADLVASEILVGELDSAGPRQSASAWSSNRAASAGDPSSSARRPSAASRSKRTASTLASSVCRT